MKTIRQTMRHVLAVALGALALSLASCQAAHAESLDSLLVDMQGLGWSDVQDEARWEAENDATMYSSAPA